MNILIAEDERITRRSLQKQLEGWGYDVVSACDGVEAWELFQGQSFDIVVTDWEMPRMDGRELVSNIRGCGMNGYVYLIMLTGRTEKADLVEGMDAGADDFLAKPFDRNELRVRLNAGERIIKLEHELEEKNQELSAMNLDLEKKVADRSAQLVQSRNAVIFGLAKLAESRDSNTGKHLERICYYVEILAREMAKSDSSIDDEWIDVLTQTAALHDIGKVAVPDAVLLKQGPLSDEEWVQMKKHPCFGGDTLLAVKERWGESPFLRTASEIALCHHEKWDGSGYPYGLSGEDIQLSARIVALADVYDALTTKRPYKSEMSHDKASGIITESTGSHLDPKVVDAFTKVEAQFKRVAEQTR